MDTIKIAERDQPASPPLLWHRRDDRRRRSARHDRSCGRTSRQDKRTAARDQAGNEHVVRPAEADRCRRPECRLRRSRPGRWPAGHPSARLALRHSQLCRCRAVLASAGYRVIVPVSARLRHDALSFERDAPQRPAVGARRRHHRLDGCAQDREGDPRRLRLGRADRQHRRGALAGALQGHGLGERLSDRQPGSRQDAAAAEGRARMVVPVLFRHRARPRRLRQIPARLFEAHLAARFAEVGLRRRHVRSQRGGLRQSGSRRHRDP